jgi:hypothetical protein
MENGVDPDSFMNASGDIVLSYRDREGLLVLRIPQKRLRRVLELEDLAMSAREDLIQELRAGFRAETGELVIDSAIIRTGVTRRFVRPARARDGKSPRKYVLSSRERRFVLSTWSKGESGDTARAQAISNKLVQRTWVVLRRECQAMKKTEDWSLLKQLVFSEFQNFRFGLKLRTLFVLHRFRVIDARKSIAKTFSALTGMFLLKRMSQ